MLPERIDVAQWDPEAPPSSCQPHPTHGEPFGWRSYLVFVMCKPATAESSSMPCTVFAASSKIG
ncbi:hypothetical protein CCR75_004032 [Bremia lactucae]|uniref:Uncharacterized protein n=1 Tax=Bremia lactucae TaxID=4779 RepID=A0A976FP08_BRELC|nr:hypothetical protein CCR75_004032 [Bremia lactucae]